MSSWAPPAFLKSNGQVGNGGTLVYSNGGFAYTNFARYWYDSIQAYQSNGVNLPGSAFRMSRIGPRATTRACLTRLRTP